MRKTPDGEVECEHSTSALLHNALWKIFYKHRTATDIKDRVIVLAGPYDCPSGARVIIDLNEVPGQRSENDAHRTLQAMATELHNKGKEFNESVTVKMTLLSKPSIPSDCLAMEQQAKQMEKALRSTT